MVSADEGWTPSPISQINNQSAEDYVQKWSVNFEYHEDHARYNELFPNQATISYQGFSSQFGRSSTPDGDYTYVKHENGTTVRYINTASIWKNAFNGVVDADSFYANFLNQGPPSSTKKREADAAKEKRAQASATGFPSPAILHSEGVIGGYYLSGSGYDDVAVFSVPSFAPETKTGPEEFQNLIGTFLSDATSKGKKKLVIDLRGNGGGRVFLGYDLFKQLFPSEDPYGASTFRASEALDLTGQYVTMELENVTYNDALADYSKNGGNGRLVTLWQSIFNYKFPITVDNKNFTSWEQYFGPQTRNGGNFTVPSRKDLLNFFADDLSLDVTGYRTRANKLNMKQPFDAKNIVMLMDGACGSTCAVFAEFMKTQGGVQTIAVGGKPETGPMQGVSGSKGSEVWAWSRINAHVAAVYDDLPQYQEQLNKTEVGKLAWAKRPLMRSIWADEFTSSSAINLRDNIRMYVSCAGSSTPVLTTIAGTILRLLLLSSSTRLLTAASSTLPTWSAIPRMCGRRLSMHTGVMRARSALMVVPARRQRCLVERVARPVPRRVLLLASAQVELLWLPLLALLVLFWCCNAT